MIIVVALSPCVDRTMVVDRLVVGEVHRPSQATVTPGGKGFNVARAAHTLGATVVAFGIVGGHSGKWLRESLNQLGVENQLLTGVNETRTSISIADASTGVMTDFYEPATSVTASEWAELESLIATAITPGDWLSISGTVPLGAPPDAVSRLVVLGRSRGASVAVDTHGAALRDAASARPDIIKVNVNEAVGLFGAPPISGPDDLADRLGALTELAIVTAGVDGACSRGLRVMSRTVGAFPVGSGDSFLAGLLTALSGSDGDLADTRLTRAALVTATAAATANALVPGAAVFSRDDFAGLCQSVVVEESN